MLPAPKSSMIVLNGPKGATFLFVSQGACGIAGVVRVNDIVGLDARLSAKILLFVCRTQARGPALIIDIFNHFMPRPYLDRIAKLIPDHVAVTAFPRLDTLMSTPVCGSSKVSTAFGKCFR